jgi:hypothetical protein
MNAKQDAKTTRINALEQLIVVLRRQNNAMRASLYERNARIAQLEWNERAAQDAAQNAVAIHR